MPMLPLATLVHMRVFGGMSAACGHRGRIWGPRSISPGAYDERTGLLGGENRPLEGSGEALWALTAAQVLSGRTCGLSAAQGHQVRAWEPRVNSPGA